jgi:hypothetical protein
MSPAGFEPKLPASERPQTHALDRAARGIGKAYVQYCLYQLWEFFLWFLHRIFRNRCYVVSLNVTMSAVAIGVQRQCGRGDKGDIVDEQRAL